MTRCPLLTFPEGKHHSSCLTGQKRRTEKSVHTAGDIVAMIQVLICLPSVLSDLQSWTYGWGFLPISRFPHTLQVVFCSRTTNIFGPLAVFQPLACHRPWYLSLTVMVKMECEHNVGMRCWWNKLKSTIRNVTRDGSAQEVRSTVAP